MSEERQDPTPETPEGRSDAPGPGSGGDTSPAGGRSGERPGPGGGQPVRPPAARGGRRGRGTRERDPMDPCLNCGDPTPGEYCPTCGQRKGDVRVSVRVLVMEVLEDQFILDRRLPRTLGALLFRPGHMTVEHVNGRIVRYIHPFRLYLVTSLLFFVLLSFVSVRLLRTAIGEGEGPAEAVADARDVAQVDSALAEVEVELADTALSEDDRATLLETRESLVERGRELREAALEREAARLDTTLAAVDERLADSTLPSGVIEVLRTTRGQLERQRLATLGQLDSLDVRGAAGGEEAAGGGSSPGGEPRTLGEMLGWDDPADQIQIRLGFEAADSAAMNQIRRLSAMEPREAVETVAGSFFNYVPTMMFLLLPVFAGVLKLLYIRRRRYYAEHFVFLLHVHSFVFLLAAVMLLLRPLGAGWLEAVLTLWMLVYIYVAMKRVYGQGWLKTFLKYWTLGWMYFWILMASIPVAFVAALLLF